VRSTGTIAIYFIEGCFHLWICGYCYSNPLYYLNFASYNSWIVQMLTEKT
jgi:hypothetical protein